MCISVSCLFRLPFPVSLRCPPTSSWLQEELPSEQEGQEDQQVHVRVQEERDVRHGRRAHLRGGHPVPQAERGQTPAGHLSG